jgi:hypothetical protein
MAESLKENLVDLLAGMPKENTIPSGEDTSGVNLKHNLGRGDSADNCVVHKHVQFPLNQREEDVSEMADDDGNGSNTNSNAVNSHKNDKSSGPFAFHKDLGPPTMEGRTCPNTLSLSLPVTAADSPQCHSRAKSFSMTLQKNITTGTGCTLILLNTSHQKMCVW